ncbi:FAD linked oxidase [Macleaya cordata]|uniref:FAD linked oxidase n=1 Tax=Macleaya cordata TaxID=56857 RepID=A0A200PLY6_MACCD|nr:FAD linked oxidase [Macleaya cordata]
MKMGISSSSILVLVLVCNFILFSFSLGASSSSSSIHTNFVQCLRNVHDSAHHETSIPVYTANTSNYSSILQSTIQNLRFLSSSTLKPHLIITPLEESHVQAAVICSKKHGIQIKVRSGGHDFEGLSYVSDVPFVIIDLFNLRSISVDVEHSTAWVQSGATLGELYYSIAEKSRTLAFPSGVCTTVGVGGQFSGGGYGTLLRKYGLAADNVIDARVVDANGRILDKESMGDDMFWAIRGGGGGSFEQGATALVHKWQDVAHKLPQELFISVMLYVANTQEKGENLKTIIASFTSLFLGAAEKLLIVMKERFPELGVESKDCIEMSWVQSTLYFARFPVEGSLDVLLNRTQIKKFYKAKSDYVKEPISQIGLEVIMKRLLEVNASMMTLSPYGGRMSEISESEIPFPHRDGNIFKMVYLVFWEEDQEGFKQASEKHISWIRKLHKYLTPYVAKSPRTSYLNYRDIDLGQSKNGTASYLQGKVWGSKYFKSNYERLVYVKSKVDSENFFRNEQS